MSEEIQVGFDVTQEQQLFQPTEKEVEVVTDIFRKFRISRDDRNRNFEYFDGINLTDYIEDSVRRFTTNVDNRENIEDWQARINTQMTRNKVLAILGKVVSVMPIAQFKGRGDEDIRKGILLTNLYEYAEDVDDYEELMIHVLLEAIVKGTAIGYEGMERKTRKIREVKGVNDDLTVTENKEIKTRLFGQIVPLEEFYPSSVSIRNVDRMPFCFWRKEMPFIQFLSEWGDFAKTSLVQPKKTHVEEEDRPFYMDFISDEVEEGNVEIIRFYDKELDQYVVLANGYWLNPIQDKDNVEEISPLPFTHKELPFWNIKFDFYGDFFYGKSLPDRLKSIQDVLNVLTNMLLDQSFLTIFPPMLTSGFDSIEDDYLRPGRRTPVDTQGLPLRDVFEKLDLGTPGGWHQFILDYTKNMMEEASVDQIQSGQAGVGGRTTAQEVRTASEGVSSLLGLFGRLINFGIKRKASLKGSNILQYWTDPKSPMIQRINGDGANEEFNNVFNTFKLNNAVLTEGKRGVKIIELFSDKSKMPTKAELSAKALVSEAESGMKTEIVALPPQYIRDFTFDVELVSNPKSEASKDLEKALQLEKVRVYMSFFPEQVDVNELAAQTAEKMGDDPSKILTDRALGIQPEEGNSEVDNGISTNPQENNANNLVRSEQGGEQGGAEMAALQASMQG